MKLFYMLWHRKATEITEKLNLKVRFDVIYHVIVGVYTQPTYMYKLAITLVRENLGGANGCPQ